MKGIFYKDQGKGTSIILLHGFCETHQIWDGFAEELALNFRVITPDLPGFGKSELPSKSFSIDEIGDQLIQWMTELKIQNPVIIGHSLGGYIALAIAKKRPKLLLGLGLFHSTVFADNDEKKLNRNKTIDFIVRNGVKPFVETFVSGLFHQKNNDQIGRVRQMALRSSIECLVAYSAAMRDRLSCEHLIRSSAIYLLVISGIHDSIVPEAISKEIAALGSKVLHYSLENTGHMGMIESKSMAILAIREFVSMCIKRDS